MNTISMSNNTLRYTPLNLGRWILWSLFAAILIAAPIVFNKGASLSILCTMGTVFGPEQQ